MASVNPRVISDLRALEGSGSPGFLAELIDLFLGEGEGLVGKLHDAQTAMDARAFERAAHTLKGSSGNLGAQAMSRICSDLQAAGQGADWTRAKELMAALDAEFAAVKTELEQEKNRR